MTRLPRQAQRSGIDKAALSRLEGGRHINPNWNMLSRDYAALGKEVALALRDTAHGESRYVLVLSAAGFSGASR